MTGLFSPSEGITSSSLPPTPALTNRGSLSSSFFFLRLRCRSSPSPFRTQSPSPSTANGGFPPLFRFHSGLPFPLPLPRLAYLPPPPPPSHRSIGIRSRMGHSPNVTINRSASSPLSRGTAKSACSPFFPLARNIIVSRFPFFPPAPSDPITAQR